MPEIPVLLEPKPEVGRHPYDPGETEIRIMKQKILVLYLHNPDLNSRVVAWSMYDGTRADSDLLEEDNRYGSPSGSAESPPYNSVVEAMRDGWRVVQFPQQFPAYPGMEYNTSYLKYEYILEKLEEVDGG